MEGERLDMLKNLFRLPNIFTGRGERALSGLTLRLECMRSEGPRKLMVITDFDMTLSKYQVNGSRGSTSFAVIERSLLMPEGYRKAVDELRLKYAPMEVDPTLTEEERTRAMECWYFNAHQLLANAGLKKEDLQRIVADGNMKLREGCSKFFDLLDSQAVPLVVLSAGIEDTLTLAMEMQASVKDNVIIMSNDLVYDEDGKVTGFSEPHITSSNKGCLQHEFAAVSSKLKGRTNVILIGDSLGDPKMADNLEEGPETLIKIGFLNHNVESLLPTYRELYDIVLTGDGDFSPINQLIQYILSDCEGLNS